jgi:hypothetical protein
MKDFADIVASWPAERAKMDRRDRALMTLRSCLLLGEDHNWIRSQNVLARLLSEEDLAAIAYTALRSLPTEIAYDVTEAANDQHGDWMPPLDPNDPSEALSIARFWAAGASDLELKAAAMVAVEKMAPRSRKGFIGWLKKKGLL